MFIEPGRAWSRSTRTDLAWANLCSSTKLPPPSPTAAAVLVSTKAKARRQRKTRPVDADGGGGCTFTTDRILMPVIGPPGAGAPAGRAKPPSAGANVPAGVIPPPAGFPWGEAGKPPSRLAAVAPSPADLLLALPHALPR